MCRTDSITADTLDAVCYHLAAIDRILSTWAVSLKDRRTAADHLDALRRLLPPLATETPPCAESTP